MNKKHLLVIGLVLMCVAPYRLALGQQVNPNDLPKCEGDVIDWHFCWGSLDERRPKGEETLYIGEFRDGLPDGLGTLRISFPEGGQRTYYGEFINGRLFGEGIVSMETGVRKFGIWEAIRFELRQEPRLLASTPLSLFFFEGLASKEETFAQSLVSLSHNPNGLRYCKRSSFFTSGINTRCWGNTAAPGAAQVNFIFQNKLFYYPLGTVYEGENLEYSDRLELAPLAFGQLRFKDGRRYKGYLKNGLPHGLGLLIDNKGNAKAGNWGGNFELKNEVALDRVISFLGNPQSFTPMASQELSTSVTDSRVAILNSNSLVVNPGKLPNCDQVNKPFHDRCWGKKTALIGNRYEGEWLNGGKEGYGIWEDSDGKLVGIFRNNRVDRGTYRLKNGDVWVGHATSVAFTSPQHGEGILFTKDGEWREGLWQDGTLIAERPTSQIQQSFFIIDEATIKFRNSAIALGRFPSASDSQNTKADAIEPIALTTDSSNRADALSPEVLQVGASSNLETTSVHGDSQAFSDGKRIALVIGNASYKSAPLDNPLNDATDIANELKRRGFEVIVRNNANLLSLRQAVRDFSDGFKKSDVGLIYYSGHGVEAKGENYLIPVDADIKKEYELSAQAYPASQLTAMMEEVQSSDDKKRVAILILDACRDNPLTRSWRSSGRGLARMDAPAGTFISFSTSPGSVASDGRGRNSPFTKHLLQAIRKPDVPIELMFKEVRVGVMGETKGEQIPWDSSSLTGDFYFSRSGKQR